MSSLKFILMDVEGTTTSLSFVHEQLFPYAKKHLENFVSEHQSDALVQECLAEVKQTMKQENLNGDEAKVLVKFIDEDRKHSALKKLQGMIWKEGYERGELKGHVYDDVPEAFERWQSEGLQLGIYSSGSVQAQKLLFQYSIHGDLTPYLSDHFDTQIGHKKEVESYQKICQHLGLHASEVLFLTDSPQEVEAASKAGLKVIHSLRPGVQAFDFDKQVKSFSDVDQFLK